MGSDGIASLKSSDGPHEKQLLRMSKPSPLQASLLRQAEVEQTHGQGALNVTSLLALIPYGKGHQNNFRDNYPLLVLK